ncbi:MAG: nucleotidyl transferase AbiEii/AbiGii toxin family protein [Deltaproteobacteria bacterium]|nr:nucleotidyl transferase AbiEii/AbiGii toxin family protein [Deltaproteobacteria bacterium]
MIPQRNLSRLSNRLAEGGGRRIPESVLERDYCLAWFLAALGRSTLGKRVTFKGGTALKRCYFGDYRFSEDLDFTLLEDASFDAILAELVPVFAEVQRASGIVFRFMRRDDQSHKNSHTFYLGFEGPLPGAAPREVKVDITIREQLVFPLDQRVVVKGYEEYEDLPDNAVVQVYSLNEIMAEKIVALGDRARNEPRDLYDAWYLADGHVVVEELVPAIASKLAFRGKKLGEIGAELKKKEARLEKLWSTRLSAQMVTRPEFEGVFRSVQRVLRAAGLE